jgi:hypothetical protein
MSKEIIVEATPEGVVTITVSGVTGPACKDLTKSFEDALGVAVSSTPTKEMYEKPLKIKQQVRQ